MMQIEVFLVYGDFRNQFTENLFGFVNSIFKFDDWVTFFAILIYTHLSDFVFQLFYSQIFIGYFEPQVVDVRVVEFDDTDQIGDSQKILLELEFDLVLTQLVDEGERLDCGRTQFVAFGLPLANVDFLLPEVEVEVADLLFTLTDLFR